MISLSILICVVLPFVLSECTPPSVWSTFGELAAKTGSSNLGQGFPDWDPPAFVLDSLKESLSHQYTRPSGHPELVRSLADRYSQHLNRNIDAMQNIAVTVGASQALYLALITLLTKEDEIIVFEPFFELYTKQIKLTGATPKYVRLGGVATTAENPWALDANALRK